jgi:hypothetical protein
LHYLAFNLLLARDGKYTNPNQGSGKSTRQDSDGTLNESLVQTLADELSNDRFIKRFFPVSSTDSTAVDCSSEDDQGGPETNPMHDYSESEKEDSTTSSTYSETDSTSQHSHGSRGENTDNSRTTVSTPSHPRREDSLSVAKMVHQRKQAAFQAELLTNPFFKPKQHSVTEHKGGGSS